jgi:energy-coupling factor transporter ATP-binding protein EcfA2
LAELVANKIGFGYRYSALVLSEISLRLRSGEQISLIGANGSGKTTLLRLLAGLLPPAHGEVTLDGEPIAPHLGKVGILFQNPDHQMIASRVEAEIALGLELRGTAPAVMRPAVEAMLSKFDLIALRNEAPDKLSGGQKQRVALAAIMIAEPQFLLLDEPDSFLDAPGRNSLLRMIESLATTCGILWALPSPKRLPLSDRYYLLSNGRLQEETALSLQHPPLTGITR